MRRTHARFDVVAEVAIAEPRDQLGQHPVGRPAVVLESAPGFELELPLPEGAHARDRIGAVGRAHERVREPRRVQQHLLHGDDVFARGAEFGDVVSDGPGHVEPALLDQDPRCGGHERFRRGKHAEPRRVVGRTERLERDDLSVLPDRDLARGEPAALHVGAGRAHELIDRAHTSPPTSANASSSRWMSGPIGA